MKRARVAGIGTICRSRRVKIRASGPNHAILGTSDESGRAEGASVHLWLRHGVNVGGRSPGNRIGELTPSGTHHIVDCELRPWLQDPPDLRTELVLVRDIHPGVQHIGRSESLRGKRDGERVSVMQGNVVGKPDPLTHSLTSIDIVACEIDAGYAASVPFRNETRSPTKAAANVQHMVG